MPQVVTWLSHQSTRALSLNKVKVEGVRVCSAWIRTTDRDRKCVLLVSCTSLKAEEEAATELPKESCRIILVMPNRLGCLVNPGKRGATEGKPDSGRSPPPLPPPLAPPPPPLISSGGVLSGGAWARRSAVVATPHKACRASSSEPPPPPSLPPTLRRLAARLPLEVPQEGLEAPGWLRTCRKRGRYSCVYCVIFSTKKQSSSCRACALQIEDRARKANVRIQNASHKCRKTP